MNRNREGERDRSMLSATVFAAEMHPSAEKWPRPPAPREGFPAHAPVRPTAPRGMVLIVVVVVVAMLSLSGLAFVVNLQTENRAARLEGRRLQLSETAASGAEWIKAFCQRPWTEQQEAGGTWQNAERFRGIVVLEDEATGRRTQFSVIAPNEAGQGGVRFGLENESGKLNLGALLRWDRREPGRAHRALMGLPGMTGSIADAILDWIDPDSSPRSSGAEADYYRDLGVAYRPRNGVPQCLEELLLVRGVTRELLFGRDEDFNDAADSQERRLSADRPAAAILSTEAGGTPWARLLTIASAERNQTLAGQPRIDLNAPDLPGLHQRLSAQLDRAWADYIVLYRQLGPYSGNKPATTSPPSVDLTRPGRVRIRSLLDLVGSKVEVPADGGQTTVFASPAGADPAALREHLTKLLDVAATNSTTVIVGKVNLNLAPREVLQAVPGLDSALVDRILIARSSQGSREDASRRFPTWLLTEGLVDLARMKTLLPYLTCGGDVFRAQVVAMADPPGPAVRVEVAIDATSVPPKQVYWKDLSLLGPGHDRATLGFEMDGPESRPRRSRLVAMPATARTP